MEQALKQTLIDAGIKFVRILWCDNANIIRAKAAHIIKSPHILPGFQQKLSSCGTTNANHQV